MTISAVLIDSREPKWVQELTFGDVPVSVQALETADLQVLTQDGSTLHIERKTPGDYLNSLKEERLYNQMQRLSQLRIVDDIKAKQMTHWPYLVITGEFRLGPNGKVITQRDTGWSYNAVMGSLLNVQELGVFVYQCEGDTDFEAAVQRLAQRKRDRLFRVLPPKIGLELGPGAAVLTALPGVGEKMMLRLLDWGGGNIAYILAGITDLDILCPLSMSRRKEIRNILGLNENQNLEYNNYLPERREKLPILEALEEKNV
jgi:ERCC4-type nuclease